VTDPALAALLDRHGLTRNRVSELFEAAAERMRAEVADVVAERERDGAIPVLAFDDVAAGTVDADTVAAVHRRGCVVIRGTFDRDLADRWDTDIARYLEQNRFEEAYLARYPDASARRIWGVYWSPSQVAARQHAAMETTRSFLNSLWRHESEGRVWFDPDHDIGYPDRLRRRAPGREAKGLPPHSDAVSCRGWRVEENERVFREVLAGRFDAYDPWDAAYRTDPDLDPHAPSAVFRTFQGWTALSEMRPEDGVLRILPIPTAAAYMLLRGIAGELGLLGGAPEPAPARFRADDLLLPALTPIPAVEPGDTVWWHGDLIHSVDDAANRTRWGNVMYIAATPRCPRNDAYRASMLERFERGMSPIDFPDEHFEAAFVGRPTVDDLNAVGRDHFGLPAPAAG
jgi:Gig2-like